MLKNFRLKFSILTIFALLASLGAVSSEAAPANRKTKNAMVAAPIPDNDTVPVLTDAEYEKLILAAKAGSASRNPAQIDRFDYATTVADDLKNMIADLQGGTYWQNQKEMPKVAAKNTAPIQNQSLSFFPGYQPGDPNTARGVKNGAELAALITKYEGAYDKLSPSAQIIAAQLIALKPYRGILYRLRPVAEAQGTPVIHGSIISYLRALNAGVNNLYPSDQWKAGFDYIARPYANMGPQIKNENELNQFIAAQVLPTQIALVHKVYRIDLSKPVYFDNKIFWDKANFVTDQDRFPMIGIPEKLAYLAAISGNVSAIYASLGYDWSDLFKATQGFWKVYGFNTMFARPDNMTAKQRRDEIVSNTKLFTKLPGGEKHTAKAYEWFIHSLRFTKASWKHLQAAGKDKGDSKSIALMDPQAFTPFTRQINTTFGNIDEVIAGKGIGSAVVGGETVDVNFKEIFMNPPEDLKALLPTQFEDGDREVVDSDTGLKYRNYSRGNPKGWDVSKYQRYFPGVKTNDDVKRTARVLSQSWGGGVLGFPLASVLY